MMDAIITEIRAELEAQADENVKASTQHFFKEEIKCYGIKSATVKKIASASYKKIKNLPKVEIYALCEQLLASGYHEEKSVAVEWAYSLRKAYTRDDFKVFEGWLNRYITNWAACDTFCGSCLGELVAMYPEFLASLKEWTKSLNRWVKRGAAVILIAPARKGMFLSDIFEIADRLLSDEDDMVQKGYGWLLKVASEAHRQEVFDYVMANKATMPRTALRYAIEKMPAEMKKEAMEKA